jgi:hypothetical protein
MIELNFTYLVKKAGIINIIDNTGLYDVVGNPTGYGLPNEERSDIISATFRITKPDNTFVEYSTTDNTITLANLQNAATQFVFIKEVDVTGYVDGAYTFKYTVTTATQTYEYEDTMYYLEGALACFMGKLSDYVNSADCCDKDSLTIMQHWLDIKGLQLNAASGNIVNADFILDRLKRRCNGC